VKFQHSVLNDSAYTVSYVLAIVIWIFRRNAFNLLLWGKCVEVFSICIFVFTNAQVCMADLFRFSVKVKT